MSKHTPGPWTVGRCTWNEDANVCYELEGIKRGSAADARLIAAAPDLLEALCTARDHIDMGALEISHCKDAKRIRAAIAKATNAS